jgi:hypothetical protein
VGELSLIVSLILSLEISLSLSLSLSLSFFLFLSRPLSFSFETLSPPLQNKISMARISPPFSSSLFVVSLCIRSGNVEGKQIG